MVPKAHMVEVASQKTKNSCRNNFNNTSKQYLVNVHDKDRYESTAVSETSFIQYDSSGTSSNSGKNEKKQDMYIQLQPHCSYNESSNRHVMNRKSMNDSDDCSPQEIENYADSDINDETVLLPHHSPAKKSKSSNQSLSDFDAEITITKDSSKKSETARAIALQTLFPFIVAGLGMVAAGIVLDKVQANRGYLEDQEKRWSIIWGNMVVVEAQAMVVAFLASLVAMVLGWIPDGKWESEHAIILCTGSLLTGAIASGLLGAVMILLIVCSTKLGINPDNVATPIAASLGDLITLSLLSVFVNLLFSVLYNDKTAWIGPAIIVLFIVLTPLFLWLSHRNEYTKDVIKHGWVPVISAMGISSVGGFILDFAVSKNPGVAVFSPVINGVGGNLVAVQASRISTYLHTSGQPIGSLPDGDKPGCISPWKTFFSSSNTHAVGARVMLLMVVPGQLVFVLIIQSLQAGHTSITPQFVAVYLLVSLIQVAVLLQVCNWMVFRLWRNGDDPDNSAIPYLTALGDLLGTGLLALGFLFLWLIGDRDMDVGD